MTAKPNLPNPNADAFLEAKVVSIHPKEIHVSLGCRTDEGLVYDTTTHKVPY